MTQCITRGKQHAESLGKYLVALKRGPAGSRSRKIIWGVTSQGSLVGGMTLDRFMAEAGDVLVESGRGYRRDDTVVLEVGECNDRRLELLAVRGRAEAAASSFLTGLFVVAVKATKEGGTDTQNTPPDRLVKALLASPDLHSRLPSVRFYARRPVFDGDFNLLGPGWHAESGILVHGPDVDPLPEVPGYAPGASAVDRLPPHLRRLLGAFCWTGDADVANAVALLLSGFLSNHFLDVPKPGGIIDGNQPGLGKTLLCQVIGRVLDDVPPDPIPLARDEELEKRLGAHLRDSASDIFFFDNVRDRIESAVLEQKILSPWVCTRLLGHSSVVRRPNTFLWLITSNLTTGTGDLVSRCIPVRLVFEGDPTRRTFAEEPLEYAARHRLEILGELAGMVYRWKGQGRPPGRQRHRCARWAEVVGGILEVAGLDQFLANAGEAVAAMDESRQDLAALAEFVVDRGEKDFFITAGGDPQGRGKLPREWAAAFEQAGACQDRLTGKSPKARDTCVGTFLSAKTDCVVPIVTALGAATATLRKLEVRNKQKRYFFEVVYDEAGDVHRRGEEGGGGAGNVEPAGGVGPQAPCAACDRVVALPAQANGVCAVRAAEEPGNDLRW